LVFVDCRTHLDRFIQTIADLQRLRALHVLFDEFAVDAFLHNNPAGRGAALASGSKASPQSAFNREVEVGVVELNHGILAAELERTMFEALGRGRPHDAPDRARPS